MSQTNGHTHDSYEDLEREVNGLRPTPAPAIVTPTVDPYHPFPVAALPRRLGSIVREGAAAIGVDPAMIALPGLATLAGCIGNCYSINLKNGSWSEPCVVWTAVIAPSSSRKSPAMDLAVEPAKTMHIEWRADYERQLRTHSPESEEPPPKFRRLLVSDITIEKLAVILEENPRGLLLARDELASWIRSFRRYGQAGSDDVNRWLELHRAGLLIVDRKMGDVRHITIPRAAVSLCGTIQPGTLRCLLSREYRDAGLAARLLVAMPPILPRRWNDFEVGQLTSSGYLGLAKELLALQPVEVPGGGIRPYHLTLSPAAKKLWVRYYDEWGQVQDTSDEDLAAAFGKLEGYAPRLAMIHHVCQHVEESTERVRTPIGPESMEAGITLARWFAHEARRVYAMLDETSEQGQVRSLIDWLHRNPRGVSVRDLQLRSRSTYPTAEVAEQALEALIKAKLASWSECPPGPQGGRPTRVAIPTSAQNTKHKTSRAPGFLHGGESEEGVVCADPKQGDAYEGID